ncbi:MAG TPA: hypothetical protein VL501_09095 [Pyrinomonadaceae bacterium]|nr:hypothetical protein [Pyrinomonadaceae bacterium]
MNRITKYLSVAAFALLALPAIASAQYGGGYGYPNGGYGYPNGGYGYPNGGYGSNSGYYGDQRSLIRNLKNKTRDFQRELDRDLDRSRYNGTRREDDINQVARDFRNAVNNLDNNGRDYNDIQRVQQLGYQVDRLIGRSRVGYNTQNLWQSIRYDLQQLGGNGYYDNNNRNRRTGGYSSRPSWWPF